MRRAKTVISLPACLSPLRSATAMPTLDAVCLHADATKRDGYERALGGRKAQVLLTDPPYCLLTRRRKGGDLRDPRAHKKIDRDPVVRFESVRDYRTFTEAWMTHAVAHLTQHPAARSQRAGAEGTVHGHLLAGPEAGLRQITLASAVPRSPSVEARRSSMRSYSGTVAMK